MRVRIAAMFGLVVTVVGVVLYVSGVAPWALVGVLIASSTFALRRTIGVAKALVLSVLACGVAAVVLAWLARGTGLDLVWVFAVGIATIALGAQARWWRRPPQLAAAGSLRDAWATGALGVTVGPVLWLATYVAARLLPQGVAVDWALRGDAANEVTFARNLLEDGGLKWGAGGHPVPLPHAVLALLVAPGRDGASADELFRRDLGTFATEWLVVLATLGLAAGIACESLLRSLGGASRPVVLVGTGIASSAIMTWLVSSYATEFGFLNAHVTLVALLLGFALAVDPRLAAWATFSSLCLIAIATLAVWGPMVIPVGAMALPSGVRIARGWRRLSVANRTSVAIASAALGAYVLTVSMPQYLSKASVFGASGGILSLPKWFPLVLVLAMLIGVWLSSRGRGDTRALEVTLAAAGGLLATLVVVALMSGTFLTNWSYYPMKAAWIGGCFALVMCLGMSPLLVSLMIGKRRRPGAAAAVVGLVGLALGSMSVTLGTRAGSTHVDPVSAMLIVGDGDRLIDVAAPAAGSEPVTVLWQAGEPAGVESAANFWNLLFAAELAKPALSEADYSELRLIAYRLDTTRADQPCRISELLDAPIRMVTVSEELAGDADALCPGRVLVDAAP